MIRADISLKSYNTFGIDVSAHRFAEAVSTDDFKSIMRSSDVKGLPILILGGGSNILFRSDFPGIVILNSIRGIETKLTGDGHVIVKAGAGEIWHELVMFCVSKGFGGIENLSLIPGTVGAAPIQNIGAYGVELKDVFVELEALDISSLAHQNEIGHSGGGEKCLFSKADCKFGYRDSVFKRESKGKYLITSVSFRLTTQNHQLNTAYGSIPDELKKMGEEPSIDSISEAVIRIRKSKLPNPEEIGNAGSFFKNPEVDLNLFESIKINFPEIVAYPASEGKMKLAAGWLVEKCGWKGRREGDAGVHEKQALVLVNYGNATGADIYNLAMKVQTSVFEKFGVKLEPEVNLV